MLLAIASLLAVFAEGNYIVSVFKGKTRPSFPSWFVFTFSMWSVFLSAYALEARTSLILIGTFATLNTIIAALSWRFGYRKFLRLDLFFLFISGIGILLWWQTANPWYALIISAGVDACGYFIMYWKLLRHPKTEDPSSWLLSTVAYGLNLFAITSWVPEEYFFSLLNALWCGLAFLLSLNKHRFLKTHPYVFSIK